MLLTALAIAPGLAICFYFFYKDAHNPEPAHYLLTSFLLGMMAVLPAGMIELGLFRHTPHSIPLSLFNAYFVVGLVEEGSKFLILRTYAFSRSSFDEPLDGIVYAVMISMGFATVENFGYVWRYGFEVAFVRMFTSVPAHATFAVVMGYFAGLAKFNTARQTKLLAYALGGAIAVHGTYDAFLLLSENHWLTQYVSDVLFVSGALFALFLAAYLSRRLVRLHFQLSEQLFFAQPRWAVQQASAVQLSQVHGLVGHAIAEAAQADNGPEQLRFLEKHWKTAEGLRLSWQQGHQFLLVFNAGIPIGFVGYQQQGASGFRLLHLFVLLRHRRRGTGRFLLHQAEAAIEGMGGTAVHLNIHPSHPSHSFFAKEGFSAITTTELNPDFAFLEKPMVRSSEKNDIESRIYPAVP